LDSIEIYFSTMSASFWVFFQRHDHVNDIVKKILFYVVKLHTSTNVDIFEPLFGRYWYQETHLLIV